MQSYATSLVDGAQHRARLTALQSADCAVLLNVIPRTADLAVPCDAFRTMLRVRLGMKADRLLHKCRCKADHTASANSHVLRCCRNAVNWCRGHNCLVGELAKIARECGYTVETRDFTKAKNDHHVVPDAELIGVGKPIVVDVSLVAVSHTDYRPNARSSINPPARSANRRETQKAEHYHNLVQSGSCVFYPMVVERESLAIGKNSEALIDVVEAASRGIMSSARLSRFTIKVRLLRAVCIGNRRLVEDAINQDAKLEYRQHRSVRLIDDPESSYAASLRGSEFGSSSSMGAFSRTAASTRTVRRCPPPSRVAAA
jgi:hypothetical protein